MFSIFVQSITGIFRIFFVSNVEKIGHAFLFLSCKHIWRKSTSEIQIFCVVKILEISNKFFKLTFYWVVLAVSSLLRFIGYIVNHYTKLLNWHIKAHFSSSCMLHLRPPGLFRLNSRQFKISNDLICLSFLNVNAPHFITSTGSRVLGKPHIYILMIYTICNIHHT